VDAVDALVSFGLGVAPRVVVGRARREEIDVERIAEALRDGERERRRTTVRRLAAIGDDDGDAAPSVRRLNQRARAPDRA
jgi:hypothetical protein